MDKDKEVIKAAAEAQRTVSFTYRGVTRHVELEVFTDGTGTEHSFITGWDTDRGAYRRFSIRPIEDFVVL